MHLGLQQRYFCKMAPSHSFVENNDEAKLVLS